MKKVFAIIILIYVHFNFAFAQDEFIRVRKDIKAGDYIITLDYTSDQYFKGGIKVSNNKTKEIIFEADSIFTGYNGDTLIDLNNDGKEELVLNLGTGATMYDYNMLLIFDFTKNKIVPFEIHNAELVTNVDEVPKIVTSIRLSPAYLGAGYTYSLQYDKGDLILETDPIKSDFLKNFIPNDEDELELFNNFKKETDECEEGSAFITYFEAYIIQMKILNMEEKGWKFFDKYYNCSNKQKAKEELRETVNEIYDYIKNSNNYVFSKTD